MPLFPHRPLPAPRNRRRAVLPRRPRRAVLPVRVPRPGPAPGARPGLALAVSAEIARDGAGGEFTRARRRVLGWLAHRLGPLPDGFAPAVAQAGASRTSDRLERRGALLRTEERSGPCGTSFRLTLDIGADSTGAEYRTAVALVRSRGGSRLHAALHTLKHRSAAEIRTVWVPGVVRRLARSPGLVDYGWRVCPEPWIIRDQDGVRGLIELISEPRRTRPIFAVGLSGGQTCPETATVDAADLAHRTAGIAHVAVITGPMTYVLTEQVGRRFSVFGNAVRTYRPGCALGQGEKQHPMALSTTVREWRPGGPPEFAAFLTREAARASVRLQDPRDASGSASRRFR